MEGNAHRQCSLTCLCSQAVMCVLCSGLGAVLEVGVVVVSAHGSTWHALSTASYWFAGDQCRRRVSGHDRLQGAGACLLHLLHPLLCSVCSRACMRAHTSDWLACCACYTVLGADLGPCMHHLAFCDRWCCSGAYVVAPAPSGPGGRCCQCGSAVRATGAAQSRGRVSEM
jgi:hypothetical protein